MSQTYKSCLRRVPRKFTCLFVQWTTHADFDIIHGQRRFITSNARHLPGLTQTLMVKFGIICLLSFSCCLKRETQLSIGSQLYWKHSIYICVFFQSSHIFYFIPIVAMSPYSIIQDWQEDGQPWTDSDARNLSKSTYIVIEYSWVNRKKSE